MVMEKGIPVQFHSDGGPRFTPREFSQFCEEWGLTHVRSNPHHHLANGTEEAATEATKHLIAKSTSRVNLDTDEFHQAMIKFRNTPQLIG